MRVILMRHAVDGGERSRSDGDRDAQRSDNHDANL